MKDGYETKLIRTEIFNYNLFISIGNLKNIRVLK